MKKFILITIPLVVILPFVQLLIWSFSKNWFYPGILPQKWGIRAWEYIGNTAAHQISDALWQTALIALLVALLSVLIALPAGRALGMTNFRGKQLIAFLLLLPLAIPPLVVSMGLHIWFIQLGLADTVLGVVLIHLTFSLPYAIFVLWGVFSNYTSDLESQARSLGANKLKVIFYVMIPMTYPGIIVAALFSFLISWSQYLSTLIIGSGQIMTLPILLFSLMGSGDRPVAAAVSLVFVIPALFVLVFSARKLGEISLNGI